MSRDESFKIAIPGLGMSPWLEFKLERRQRDRESIQHLLIERLTSLAGGKRDIKILSDGRQCNPETQLCEVLARAAVGTQRKRQVRRLISSHLHSSLTEALRYKILAILPPSRIPLDE